jgi:hypothetical protein
MRAQIRIPFRSRHGHIQKTLNGQRIDA